MGYIVTGGFTLLAIGLFATVITDLVYYFGYWSEYKNEINNVGRNFKINITMLKMIQGYILAAMIVYVLIWGGVKGIKHALK